MKIKAYKKLMEDLIKLRIKAQAKADKEKEKNNKKFIMFKGVECYSEEDILDIWGFGDCTEKEYNSAIERLNKKLNIDWNGETEIGIYIKCISSIISSLYNEIQTLEFNALPSEEKRRILEERNKEVGADY